jgi:hypothetical protein
MASPTLPFWMLQRQIVAESVNDHTVRLTGPILPPCEVTVAPRAEGGFRLVVERCGESGKTLVAEAESTQPAADAAWQAAFEIYRQQIIV